MVCYNPLQGYQGPGGRIVPVPSQSLFAIPMVVPCGGCLGCRIARSAEKAIRCVHELKTTPGQVGSFLTLTYAPEHLPNPPSISTSVMQNFMKRLRFNTGLTLRYLACGEYGEENLRPHYHVCLLGSEFPDRELWKTRNGHRYLRSAELERAWPFGHCVVGELNFTTAAYVGRYILKKINGDMAQEHYTHFDPDTGEVWYEREPERVWSSNRPGLGHEWAMQYMGDCYPSGFITHDGFKLPVPRYYRKLAERHFPDRLAAYKQSLREKNGPVRHLTSEEVIQLKTSLLKKQLDMKRLVRNLE